MLTAAARVLVRHGYEDATTNRIAEAAGISVGSLYQYFPNKEAIVAALFERHSQHMWDAFASNLEGLWAQPLVAAVPAVIDALVQAHAVEPRLHRVLHEQVPRVGGLDRHKELNRRGAELITRFLVAHRDETDVADPELAAFVLVESIEALIHASVDAHLARGVDLGRVRAEAARMALRYLGVA